MPIASINGIRLNFELRGESGEPFVLVHGYTGDITDWRHQIPAFSPSFRVLMADNRGHGQSEAPADRSVYTIDHMARDAMGLVDERASTASTCWGTRWAERSRRRLRSLIQRGFSP